MRNFANVGEACGGFRARVRMGEQMRRGHPNGLLRLDDGDLVFSGFNRLEDIPHTRVFNRATLEPVTPQPNRVLYAHQQS